VFSHKQCDQIGRIFIQWGIVCFGQSLESYRSIPAPRTFGLLYFMDKFKHKFRQKMGWAIFWAIFFSQIHLVTLATNGKVVLRIYLHMLKQVKTIQP
jgi:hypothetical protein